MVVVTCTICTRRNARARSSVLGSSLLSVLLAMGLLASPAFAQGGRTEITGTVVDQGKAVLPGVTSPSSTRPPGWNAPPSRAVTGGS